MVDMLDIWRWLIALSCVINTIHMLHISSSQMGTVSDNTDVFFFVHLTTNTVHGPTQSRVTQE